LEQLYVRGFVGSASELARATGLSARAVSRELQGLERHGLVVSRARGSADRVEASQRRALGPHLEALFKSGPNRRVDSVELRRSLRAWGAPLAGVRPRKADTLETTLVAALDLARRDASVLVVLPAVVARNARHVDWERLRRAAREQKVKAELGLVLELASRLAGALDVRAEARPLVDRRRRGFRAFPEAGDRFALALAKARSPRPALRWGFWMNLSEASFQNAWEASGATVLER
jgi:DNA-binding transcriptional ArsR family regulator